MKVIIIGGGESGLELARLLSGRHDIYVLDSDPAVAERFSSLNVEFITGSGTSPAVLARADAEHCDVLVACTGQDEVNLVACSMARKLGHPETVCFISKEELATSFGEGNVLGEHFGIDRLVWPEAQLADDIERIIAEPGALDAEAFAGGQIRLLEYRIEPDSAFTRGPVSSLHLPHGSLIVAVKRGDAIFIPRGHTHLAAGDKVIVMGRAEAMRAVRARFTAPVRKGASSRLVTIVGGGDVGSRLAMRLDASPDIRLKVIERDRLRGEWLASTLTRALVVHGDGTDPELLEAEEVGRSDVLVSVIDNDERNLLASLIGRQLGARRIVTRVSRRAHLRLFQRVGIDVALSARGAAVAAVAHRIDGGKAVLLAVLEEGQAQVIEVVVPDGIQPARLRDLAPPAEAIVGAILRGRAAIVPSGEDEIRPGDHLLVFTTQAAADQIRDFFGQPAA